MNEDPELNSKESIPSEPHHEQAQQLNPTEPSERQHTSLWESTAGPRIIMPREAVATTKPNQRSESTQLNANATAGEHLLTNEPQPQSAQKDTEDAPTYGAPKPQPQKSYGWAPPQTLHGITPTSSSATPPSFGVTPENTAASNGSQPAYAKSGQSGAALPYPGAPTSAAAPIPARAKAKSGPGWMAAIAMSVAAALIGGGIGVGGNEALRPSTSMSTSSPAAPQSTATKVVQATGEAPNWQQVQQAVGDAVVAIDTQLEGGTAAGSGVIIDAEGHVLTNDHVISGGTNIYVTLADGRLYKAELAGTDEATDLAVITILNPPSDLTVAQLGDSSNLHVGQNVAAIGNPLGLSSTMTTGIISALNRPVTTQKESQDKGSGGANSLEELFGHGGAGQQNSSPQVVTNAIQLDAAVNPGNSGGPVFDSSGRVIGIASSIATISGTSAEGSGSIGLGFAIPINLAKNVSAQLIKNGVAEHAFLGVTVTDGIAEYEGAARVGAEVNSVSENTPAAKAKIRKGDVILKIDGNDVSSATALTGFVRQYASGDVVTLTLERDGELLDVEVELATRQD